MKKKIRIRIRIHEWANEYEINKVKKALKLWKTERMSEKLTEF